MLGPHKRFIFKPAVDPVLAALGLAPPTSGAQALFQPGFFAGNARPIASREIAAGTGSTGNAGTTQNLPTRAPALLYDNTKAQNSSWSFGGILSALFGIQPANATEMDHLRQARDQQAQTNIIQHQTTDQPPLQALPEGIPVLQPTRLDSIHQEILRIKELAPNEVQQEGTLVANYVRYLEQGALGIRDERLPLSTYLGRSADYAREVFGKDPWISMVANDGWSMCDPNDSKELAVAIDFVGNGIQYVFGHVDHLLKHAISYPSEGAPLSTAYTQAAAATAIQAFLNLPPVRAADDFLHRHLTDGQYTAVTTGALFGAGKVASVVTRSLGNGARAAYTEGRTLVHDIKTTAKLKKPITNVTAVPIHGKILDLKSSKTKPSMKVAGKEYSFTTSGDARKFGNNEAFRKEANRWFSKPSNQMMEGADIPKYSKFLVTEMPDGGIVMEYTSLSREPGRSKRYIRVLDKHAQEVDSFKETINPRGWVIEVKKF